MSTHKYLKIGLILIALVFLALPTLEAQCPMCKMAVESNLKGGGSAGKGLNAGILYMLATPYVLVGSRCPQLSTRHMKLLPNSHRLFTVNCQ